MPERAHKADAGADLRTPNAFNLWAGCAEIVDTGVHMEIPEGYCGLLVSKSGLNVHDGITSTGLIDAGYTGSIKVKLYNRGDRMKRFAPGDKISQIVILPVECVGFRQVNSLSDSERGNDGFGSSGR